MAEDRYLKNRQLVYDLLKQEGYTDQQLGGNPDALFNDRNNASSAYKYLYGAGYTGLAKDENEFLSKIYEPEQPIKAQEEPKHDPVAVAEGRAMFEANRPFSRQSVEEVASQPSFRPTHETEQVGQPAPEQVSQKEEPVVDPHERQTLVENVAKAYQDSKPIIDEYEARWKEYQADTDNELSGPEQEEKKKWLDENNERYRNARAAISEAEGRLNIYDKPKDMERLREKRAEARKHKDPQQVIARGITPFGRDNTGKPSKEAQEYSEYNVADDLYSMAEQTLNQGSKYDPGYEGGWAEQLWTAVQQFGQGAANNFDKGSLTFGLSEGNALTTARKVGDKYNQIIDDTIKKFGYSEEDITNLIDSIKNGGEGAEKYLSIMSAIEDAVDEGLTDGEKSILDGLEEFLSAKMKRSGDVSVAAAAGAGAEQSAEFMLDFVLTGGLTKAGTKAAAKLASRRLMKKLGEKGAKAVSTVLSDAGVAAARTAIMFPRSLQSYGENLVQMNNGTDELGRYQFDRDRKNAALNTALSQYIEYWTEGFGNYLSAGEQWLFKKVTKAAPRTAIGKTLKNYRGSIGKYLDYGKFDGMFNEMMEEVAGSALTTLNGWLSYDRETGESKVGDKEAWKEFWAGEQLATLALSFLPMSAISASTNIRAYNKMKERYNDGVKVLNQFIDRGALSQEELDGLVSDIENKTPEELKDKIVAISDKVRKDNGGTLPDNFTQSLMGYVEGTFVMNLNNEAWENSQEKLGVVNAYTEQFENPNEANAWDLAKIESVARENALEAGIDENTLGHDAYVLAREAQAIKETVPEQYVALMGYATAKAANQGLKDGYDREGELAFADYENDVMQNVAVDGHSIVRAQMTTPDGVIGVFVVSPDAKVNEDGTITTPTGADGLIQYLENEGGEVKTAKANSFSGAFTEEASTFLENKAKDLKLYRDASFDEAKNTISPAGMSQSISDNTGKTVYIHGNGAYEPVRIERMTNNGASVVISGDKEALNGVALAVGINTPGGQMLELPVQSLYPLLATNDNGSITADQKDVPTAKQEENDIQQEITPESDIEGLAGKQVRVTINGEQQDVDVLSSSGDSVTFEYEDENGNNQRNTVSKEEFVNLMNGTEIPAEQELVQQESIGDENANQEIAEAPEQPVEEVPQAIAEEGVIPFDQETGERAYDAEGVSVDDSWNAIHEDWGNDADSESYIIEQSNDARKAYGKAKDAVEKGQIEIEEISNLPREKGEGPAAKQKRIEAAIAKVNERIAKEMEALPELERKLNHWNALRARVDQDIKRRNLQEQAEMEPKSLEEAIAYTLSNFFKGGQRLNIDDVKGASGIDDASLRRQGWSFVLSKNGLTIDNFVHNILSGDKLAGQFVTDEQDAINMVADMIKSMSRKDVGNLIADNREEEKKKEEAYIQGLIEQEKQAAAEQGESVAPVNISDYDDLPPDEIIRAGIRRTEAPVKTKKVYKLMRLGDDGKLYPLFIDSASPIELGKWYDADSPEMDFLKKLPAGTYLVNPSDGTATSLEDYQQQNGKKATRYPSVEDVNEASKNGMRWVKITDTENGQRRYDGENRKYENIGINGSGSVSTFAMRPGWHAGSLPTMRQIGKGADKNLRDNRFVWVEGEVSADVDYTNEANANPDKDIPTHIPTDGYYMKATNANKKASQADRVGWYVAGAFKPERIISDAEARSIIDKWNEEHPDAKVEYDWPREGGKDFVPAAYYTPTVPYVDVNEFEEKLSDVVKMVEDALDKYGESSEEYNELLEQQEAILKDYIDAIDPQHIPVTVTSYGKLKDYFQSIGMSAESARVNADYMRDNEAYGAYFNGRMVFVAEKNKTIEAMREHYTHERQHYINERDDLAKKLFDKVSGNLNILEDGLARFVGGSMANKYRVYYRNEPSYMADEIIAYSMGLAYEDPAFANNPKFSQLANEIQEFINEQINEQFKDSYRPAIQGRRYQYLNDTEGSRSSTQATEGESGEVPGGSRGNDEGIDGYSGETIRAGVESGSSNDIFFSNAERAVESIKNDKATPQQWLAMLEKNGGLKAGEDKWLGLSDWLKASDKKTLTKQEVLNYINQNKIQVEEVGYFDAEHSGILKDLQEEFDTIPFKTNDAKWEDADNRLAEFYQEMRDKYGDDYLDKLNLTEQAIEENLMEERESYEGEQDDFQSAYDAMVEKYGDDFKLAFGQKNGKLFVDDLDAAEHFLNKRAINDVRLGYTTEGLTNKREIALTVPTIEPWNENDGIHFGDAGEGRAIAWARIGDAKLQADNGVVNEAKEKHAKADDAFNSLVRELKKKYDVGTYGELLGVVTREERAELSKLGEESGNTLNELDSLVSKGGGKVLFIDEIQSKRHQEAREQGGYRDDAALKKAEERRAKAYDAYYGYAGRLIEKYGDDMRDKMTPEEEEEYQRLYSAYRNAENSVARNGFDPMEDAEYRRIREEQYAFEHGGEFARLMEEWKNAEGFEARQEINEKLKPFQERNREYFEAMDSREKELADEFNKKHKSTVPAAPFEKNWHELAMKRMLRLAAEEGYDYVAWTTGDQQAERYNIGTVVNGIDVYPPQEDLQTRIARLDLVSGGPMMLLINNDGVIETGEYGGKRLDEVVGKPLAERIMTMKERGRIEGEGLRVGGEGMKGFYDDILPRFMNKYGKKWGVQVEDITLPNVEKAGSTVHAVRITPETKESVMQGQPMFREGENTALFNAAKEYFGQTSDIREAGYILPDGTLLDFSGRHLLDNGSDSSFLNGRRTTDHREVASLAYEKDGNTPTGIDTSMEDFIRRGAIRIDANGGVINLATKPTPEQRKALVQLIKRNGGDVYVDYGAGNTERYDEYENAYTTDVIADIDRFFDEPGRKARVGLAAAELELTEKRLDDMSRELGIKINRVSREQMPKGHESDKGFYNHQTGEMTICMDNVSDERDAIATVLHETVGHHGLRKLLGAYFYDAMVRIHSMLDREGREWVNQYIVSHNLNIGDTNAIIRGVEEYLSYLAESGDFQKSTWQKIKEFFGRLVDMILGTDGFVFTDNELNYILRASYENLKNPDWLETPEGKAADTLMKRALGINESNPRYNTDPECKELGNLYRDGLTGTARIDYDALAGRDWAEFRRENQDADLPVRYGYEAIQNEKGITEIPEDEDYLTLHNLASSRAETESHNFELFKFEPLLEQVRAIQEKLLNGKSGKTARKEAYDRIMDYMYAVSALERNEYKNANLEDAEKRDWSGITDLMGRPADEWREAEDDARAMIDAFQAEVADDAALNELWNRVRACTDFNLDHAYNHGLLTLQEYETLRGTDTKPRMWEYYLPLRGFNDETAEEAFSYTSFVGDTGRKDSPVVKKMKGRKTKADNPLANILRIAEDEIVQGNENRAKQALYRFVLNAGENSLLTEVEPWYVKDNATGKYMLAEPAPGQSIEDFEKDMEAARAAGNAHKGRRGLKLDQIMANKAHQNEHMIRLKVGGKDKMIWVNGNPALAKAVNGTGRKQNLQAIRRASRALSNLFTTYSLNFTAKNLIRDTIYSRVAMMVKEDRAYRHKFTKNWIQNLGYGAFAFPMVRLAAQWENGKLQKKDPAKRSKREQMFIDFMTDGGQTGYTIINSVSQIKKEIERSMKRAGAKGHTFPIIGHYAKFVKTLNEGFELLTRFTAYETSRDMGRSGQRAASDAKEISVNFNRRGAQDGNGVWGIVASYLGATHYFYNAGVQGFENFLRLFKTNPYKMVPITASFAIMGVITPMINAMLAGLVAGAGGDGDDDDEKKKKKSWFKKASDEQRADWYWNLPEWVRRNNIILGTGEWYMAIPLPVELRAVYGLGDIAGSYMQHKVANKNWADFSLDIINTVGEVLPFNPVEGFSPSNKNVGDALLRAVVPDATIFFVDWATNRDYTGRPLKKESINGALANSQGAYASTPKQLVEACQWLAEKTADKPVHIDLAPGVIRDFANNYGGGFWRAAEDVAKMYTGIFSGDPERPFRYDNIPFLSGFTGHIDEDRSNSYVTNVLYDYENNQEDVIKRIRTASRNKDLKTDDIFDHPDNLDASAKMVITARPKEYELAKMYRDGMNTQYKWLPRKRDSKYGKKGELYKSQEVEKYGVTKLREEWVNARNRFANGEATELDVDNAWHAYYDAQADLADKLMDYEYDNPGPSINQRVYKAAKDLRKK